MTLEILAQKRDLLGKKVNKLRKDGMVPAELYGKNLTNNHLMLSYKDIHKAYQKAGENTVVNLNFEGRIYPVLIHNISVHPVTSDILSVDFYVVNMKEVVKTSVPVSFKGISKAVKEKGGVLIKVMKDLVVEALPSIIPHEISIDISKLDEIGSAIYIKDIDVSKDIKILAEEDAVIVMIKAQLTEEEEIAIRSANVELDKIEISGKKKVEEAEVDAK